MAELNLAVIYYSSTGTNHQMAQWAQEAGNDVGANVRLLKIPETAPMEAIESNPAWKEHYDKSQNVEEATPEDLEWADAIVFSAPTRFGVEASQFRAFIDTTGGLWAQGKLMNKAVSAMSSAQNPHGGQEATVLSIYKTMAHWGAIIVPPGYTDPVQFSSGGNPYGVSATATEEGIVEDIEEAVKHQAKRTVQVAKWIKDGQGNQ